MTLLSAAMALGQGRGQRARRWPATGWRSSRECAAGAAILESSLRQLSRRGCRSRSYHFESPDGYRDIVNSMIAAGAQVTPQELPVLVDYLFTTYGKKPAAGAAAPAPQQPIRARRFWKPPARPVMDWIHWPATFTTRRNRTRVLIRNMIGYGAAVTDAQIPTLVEYMFKTYGKKPAAAPAPAARRLPLQLPIPARRFWNPPARFATASTGSRITPTRVKEPYESLVQAAWSPTAPSSPTRKCLRSSTTCSRPTAKSSVLDCSSFPRGVAQPG